MYLGENNGNLSETKNVFYSQPFLKMRKFLLGMRKDFLIMSNFYLVEILSEPNSLTIVTSKKILKMSNYVLILSIFFLKMRIRNLQCNNGIIPNKKKVYQANWFKFPEMLRPWSEREGRGPGPRGKSWIYVIAWLHCSCLLFELTYRSQLYLLIYFLLKLAFA